MFIVWIWFVVLLIVFFVYEGELECVWEVGEWEDWDLDVGDFCDDERNKDLYFVGFKYIYCDKEGGWLGCIFGYY